jgi:hypothetical protein
MGGAIVTRILILVFAFTPCGSLTCEMRISPDAMGRVYERKEHPRLDIICGTEEPVLFSKDSPST